MYLKKKACKLCGEIKDIEEFYFQEKTNSKGEKYIYYNTECKDCVKEKATKWRKANPEKYKEIKLKCEAKELSKQKKKIADQNFRDRGGLRKYYRKHKNQFKVYQKIRIEHKTHEIEEDEWLECLHFFNYSCAYCGMSDDEAILKYKQVLHKEHVEHNGANDITNCVPACKGCNSSKGVFDILDWYNENNPIYSKERHEKITEWILSFTI